ncbi:unnamed protein product [Darwinula stevensoni]|uniref:Uncharacterized protein n=1 Tax=Darwinula stevensoni TaxID=69355 RepID=A0A7R9FPF4_9CRUS|nr:unnamed protein product [Darwinula stevensoni]CAG0897903.1 unnamed protein product [Darwinula stevensoni]
MKTFKEIFNLYVCAASAVDLPRNPTQLHSKIEEQMQKMLAILTPQQRDLVRNQSKVIFVTGTSGTGKTFILVRRALQLARDGDVLVLNLPGGDLTDVFRREFQETEKIVVAEGRDENLEVDIEKLKSFLRIKGEGKHVLIDEVPLTLGFKDTITSEGLSDHWAWINDLVQDDKLHNGSSKMKYLKSITLFFRPNDQSYKRDFSLRDVKPGGLEIAILNQVKRNTKHISELFISVGNFSRRVFVSSERSLKIEGEKPGRECLPRFIEMTSCQKLHRECKEKLVCEVVRASYAIYEECKEALENRPVFVVVDEEFRRDAVVNILMFLYPKLPVHFYWINDIHGKPAPNGTFPLVVVTEEEMMGCHPLNVTCLLQGRVIKLRRTTGAWLVFQAFISFLEATVPIIGSALGHSVRAKRGIDVSDGIGCLLLDSEVIKKKQANLHLRNFSRRVFVSSERSLKIEGEKPGRECLPRFIEMTSCQKLHRECKEKLVCEVVRASYAIYEECKEALENRPVFVVVDEEFRRDAVVNILMFLYPKLPVHFYWINDIHGKPAPNGTFPLVVVTEEEMMGCHPLNVTVVLDFPRSQWKNYCRLIATTGGNKIVVVEEEEWKTGKFSHVPMEVKEMGGWKIEKKNIDEIDLAEKLEEACLMYEEKDIGYLEEAGLDQQSFPRIDLDQDGKEGREDEDVEKMLNCRLSRIFGYPASGKSRKVNALIGRVTCGVLLLHCGSKLSRQVAEHRWRGKANVKVSAKDFSSLKDIFDAVEREKVEKKMKTNVKNIHFGGKKKIERRRDRREEKEEEDDTETLIVVVEDCPLFKEFQGDTVGESFKERLKEIKVKLILSFKSHTDDASGTSLDEAARLLDDDEGCITIVHRCQPTSRALMKYIRENETRTALNLESKNLSVSANPASIVTGIPVKYIDIEAKECPGRHSGYVCSKTSTCGITANVLSALFQSKFFEEKNEPPHILVSEEGLLEPLRIKVANIWSNVQVKHLEKKAPTLRSQQTTMKKENLVLAETLPTDPEKDRSILLRLDDQEMFLEGPTWNEVGMRVGEEALKKGNFFDENTGAIIDGISPATWSAINEKLSPTSSSPFTDWGYMWQAKMFRESDNKEEVTADRATHSKRSDRKRSDEFGRKFKEKIDQDPGRNMNDLAKEMGVARSTISLAVRKDLQCKSFVLRNRKLYRGIIGAFPKNAEA